MKTKAAQHKLPDPLPAHPLGRRLCELFSYRWLPIVADNSADTHLKPDWHSIKDYPLRPRVLWDYWQDANKLVGVRFGHQTSYALIDIDKGGCYHPAQDPDALGRIRTALEKIGIVRSLLLRSSYRGGLHLYLPLPDSVPTFWLAVAIKQCLGQKFSIQQGHLEILPNVKSYAQDGNFTEYQAHNLPLQPGSGSILLNDDGQATSADLTEFFSQWDMAAAGQDMAALNRAIATAKKTYKGTWLHRPSKTVDAWERDLATEIEAGWTGPDQTNPLLKTIACYGRVFERLGGQELTEYVKRIAKSCPGYEQWCHHQHEIDKRAREWTTCVEKRYYPLGSKPHQQGKATQPAANNVVPFNQQRAEDAQARIKRAVKELEGQGTLPDLVSARAKAIAAYGNVSTKTLYRYPDLWHPSHRAENEECKTVEQEPDLAISASFPLSKQEAQNTCNSKEFYTSPLMKGLAEPAEKFSSFKKTTTKGGQGGGFPQACLGAEMHQGQPISSTQCQGAFLSIGDVLSQSSLSSASALVFSQQTALLGINSESEESQQSPRILIGKYARRLGWGLNEIQQYILDQFGKTHHHLSDEELYLLLLRLQHLQKNSTS